MAGRNNKRRFTILCEGMRDYQFARAYLQKRFGKRQAECIRVDIPHGLGAGSAHVRDRYPVELQAHRSRRYQRNAWLVVMIDADTGTLEERLGELGASAARADIDPPTRREEDRVLLLVPQRNIETWMRWAEGKDVADDKNYKRNYHNVGSVQPFGRMAADRCRDVDAATLPESLQHACNEVARLNDQ